MTIKVREIKLKNNQISVMLDKHYEGGRKQQVLKGIKYADFPKNAVEREFKKAQKELVKRIVAKMELDKNYENFSIDKDYQLKADFFEYCEDFVTRKIKLADMRGYKAVLQKLRIWTGKTKLTCGSIDEDLLLQFKDYLNSELNGISPYNYFKKLKRMTKEATIARYFKKDPAVNILNNKGKCTEKDTLTEEEIGLLSNTDCRNKTVKNAFLFSCYTGIRFCDTVALKWNNISEGCVDFIQLKTKERVINKLHESIIPLIGEEKNKAELIFKLPTHTGCLKILKSWVASAGIEKHITWHCARHTFATSLINVGVDILTASKLLGHKSMMQTQTYLRISDARKEEAVNKLPKLF